MSQPRKVALAFDFYATWGAPIADNGIVQLAFSPVAFKSSPPSNANGNAVPALVAHEILVTNPGGAALIVAPAIVEDPTTLVWLLKTTVNRPAYVDPTTFPAVTAANGIVVPAGAIAFPIRVRAYGLTISSPFGATEPSVQAYGPISLEA